MPERPVPSGPTPESAPSPAVVAAADALAEAAARATACPPVRTLLPSDDLTTAYAVQQLGVRRALARGRRLTGRKIGLTSPAVQRQLGVDQPDFGALFADMAVPEGTPVPAGLLLQPKVEAEVALVLDRDLPHTDCTVADVMAATGFCLAALEIVDSRISGWDISIVDTVADNASSGLYVLGSRPVPLTGLDLRAVTMTLTRNGEPASAGTGADCLGSPLNAAAWLASTLAAAGDPLRAGDVVLTGALGPMVPAAPGDVFEARISALGSAGAEFAMTAEGAR
ncbi:MULTISPECIES: 2-keto-4-pentenoate hydratase [Streptomyces]|uniref:2-keto-4-pentenoate hydratase n=1 Tax=Streptomyces TaxID=1883 RepID=UPI001040D60F|nr:MULTISPECIES: fumarylacetoacetate hydrolase family protein [Streptomyces]MBT3074820.1 fumarylacetoacetate hydrolase family protein [Streptomyces sp. COG21]MBT3081873.1 fumarylacetoacetate hydrolase family protein [Streptomyces sp. COG20]MBT3085095.1 fumarylacetoacetate hydrolase family protein [Streptomyces sp. CYG21]MBT3098138.1 fumarylacetoacetate hydrolase family protein [Streptomyces sp. CBG30]MBT3105804.1 fumarylacetoacetate hydrolase family protein [Streptomyces sp. COG19]